MATSSSNYLLSAADVTWGRREKTCFDITGIAAAALSAKYFNLDAPASHGGTGADFYVWFDLDAGSVDPTPAGRTGIEVDVATGDDEATMIAAMVAAIDANANFQSKVDADNTSIAIIENFYLGAVTATADVDTSAVFTQSVEGIGGSIGRTSGGVEMTVEQGSAMVTSDQSGGSEGLTLDKLLLGSKATVSMSLLEMTAARWSTVIGGVTGSDHTPSAGTKMTGMGEDRLYQSFFDLGGLLILHPTRNASTDRSQDITFWKTAPLPESYNFSGEEASVMAVSFEAVADPDVDTAINLWAYGDSEQDVR